MNDRGRSDRLRNGIYEGNDDDSKNRCFLSPRSEIFVFNMPVFFTKCK